MTYNLQHTTYNRVDLCPTFFFTSTIVPSFKILKVNHSMRRCSRFCSHNLEVKPSKGGNKLMEEPEASVGKNTGRISILLKHGNSSENLKNQKVLLNQKNAVV